MLWKAGIEGHRFDLETLGELFSAGDPRVGQDSSGAYFIESATLQYPNGQINSNAAQALIRRINGTARAADSGFQPISLTDRYTAPDGSATVALSPVALMGRVRGKAVATVLDSNGNPVTAQAPIPKGPRYVKVPDQDPNVADAHRVLGQLEPLDWYDIYKVWEIVEHAVGGFRQMEKLGWVAKADVNRLTASANHPGISGDEARHARAKGTPGANLSMTMSEAEGLVRRLVANWVESHPSY